MEGAPRHAIVFGASGLIGWAVVDQLLRSYPEAGAFSKITAVTNRRVQFAESHWPEPGANRPELHLVSGIDLRRGGGGALARSLDRAVEDIHTVTHVFYLGTSETDGMRKVWGVKQAYISFHRGRR
ncbi:putative sirq protein [Rosellinia necatrix]|uniref:Putative sirq protein n=1 Tax=Rosellinia necatrix TaxID=77044 RepID=A0A1S8AAX8_ROSNE|nr:putative sirq protein [Rosellinia necatrix]